MSDLDKFRTRGFKRRSPIKWRDSDEEEEKKEWRRSVGERLGEKKEVDTERIVKIKRK